ncbi:hypothetical protein [Xanthomonas bundabergensis]|uniref:hypothetical protein n=1 Tax=Xanthomonas bundabergensis TaxID=3160842 RepID=UPI003517BC83
MLGQLDTTIAAAGIPCAQGTGSSVDRMPLSVRASHRSHSIRQTHAATPHPGDALSGQAMRGPAAA